MATAMNLIRRETVGYFRLYTCQPNSHLQWTEVGKHYATTVNQVCSQDSRMKAESSPSTSGASCGRCCCREKHADDWSPRDTQRKTRQWICLILMLLLTLCITSGPSVVYFTIRVSEFKTDAAFSWVLIFPVKTFSLYMWRTFLPQIFSLHTGRVSRMHALGIIALYNAGPAP